MKINKYLFIPLAILLFNFSVSGRGVVYNVKSFKDSSALNSHILPTNAQIVYICTGKYAYAYHSRSTCTGLNNCKGEIKYTDEYTAVNDFGRKACCRCWSNAISDCKDDASTYGGSGGSGDGDAYAYIAVAVIAASAIVLSNDLYVYPTYSFFKGENPSYGQELSNKNGAGFVFGFRKKFKHSALEYGLSYIKFDETIYNYGNGYLYSYNQSRSGIHFNFVQQMFYDRTPDWLKVYLGPSLNLVSEFGYGGIVGSEIKLLDRLRFDLRYERTTQTNQVQAGLIFTYQKKYFWQKN